MELCQGTIKDFVEGNIDVLALNNESVNAQHSKIMKQMASGLKYIHEDWGSEYLILIYLDNQFLYN